ncbi:MAG: 4-hydroxybenzoate octaprenyltransferase [Alphaproteobacteria bacterium]|jgi:4-hydroxybenzoate polyprenyltransferase|nr:4-hydroxybenzoate octaprenyltransferase [Alphaproteobacteria bacterium]MBT5827575.1 4-hydroxybenzoate octaprenyltransferase [Alphaproteobacteria bacterium]
MLDKLILYTSLIRLNKPIGTILLLLPILLVFIILDSEFLYLDILAIFVCLSFIMRSVGCVINDLLDVKFDQKVARTKNRPLASGKLTILEAIILLVILLLLGLYLAMFLKFETLIRSIFIIVPIFFYPLMKRFFIYPQLFLGLTFNLGILIAAYEIKGYVSTEIMILYLSFAFLTVAYDTIYAHQDKKDDIMLKLNSTAISFGQNSKNIIFFCYLVFMLGLLFIGLSLGFKILFFLSLEFLFLFVFYLVNFLDLNNKDQCGLFFNANGYFLLAVNLIFLAANYIY